MLYSFSNTLPENHQSELTDELEHVLKVVEHCKVNWKRIDTTHEDLLAILKNSIQIQGSYTQQRFHIFNVEIYKAGGSCGIDVLLSGFGGDETVSARTGFSYPDLIAEKKWNELVNTLIKDQSGFYNRFKNLERFYIPFI
ncbi:MAG: hypothetical protein HC906_16555 [Bacteroidales bacterium]|nr:hypothetical protein [Bacteroidales bacterium]